MKYRAKHDDKRQYSSIHSFFLAYLHNSHPELCLTSSRLPTVNPVGLHDLVGTTAVRASVRVAAAYQAVTPLLLRQVGIVCEALLDISIRFGMSR